ncbi:MAG: GH23, partial [uncultured Gemmatimonadetes bacterium]
EPVRGPPWAPGEGARTPGQRLPVADPLTGRSGDAAGHHRRAGGRGGYGRPRHQGWQGAPQPGSHRHQGGRGPEAARRGGEEPGRAPARRERRARHGPVPGRGVPPQGLHHLRQAGPGDLRGRGEERNRPAHRLRAGEDGERVQGLRDQPRGRHRPHAADDPHGALVQEGRHRRPAARLGHQPGDRLPLPEGADRPLPRRRRAGADGLQPRHGHGRQGAQARRRPRQRLRREGAQPL